MIESPDLRPAAEAVADYIDEPYRTMAHGLLDAGWRILVAWGPVQMAVLRLEVERDGARVLFDSERGFTSVVLTTRGQESWWAEATFAWARERDAEGRMRSPDYRPELAASTFWWETGDFRREAELADGPLFPVVLEWLPGADLGLLAAITDCVRTNRGKAPEATSEALIERAIAELENAVAGYYARRDSTT